ncbi:MAG: endonuclease/exonuclease/phosphatase family protein [Alphaproteobacteria bacterium]|nr:endonuclease/exonuclease/phosphatase family protein [Alphaproteobacteria bacterium]
MNLVFGTAINAAILGLAAVVFGALFGKFHPLLDLFSQFVLPAIVGAIAVALLAAILGRHVQLLIVMGLAITCLAIAWPWLQQPAKTEATGPRFKLMSFNVYYNNPDFAGVAKLVQETKPDIVVLLEVLPRVRPGLDAVVNQFPYRVECWQEQWCDALILSRFPLTDIRASLPEPKFRRPMGAVTIEIEERTLTLFPAHLTLPYPLERTNSQAGEIKEIAATIATIGGARILAGDFNASTWGATMTYACEQLEFTALTGPDGTWPTFLPAQMGIPIDHILASEELALLSRQILTVQGSDHRAVLAEIAFKE